jgi:hypothetical protein
MEVGKSTADKGARQWRQKRKGDEVNTRPISEERRRIKGLEREIQQLKMEK